MFANLLFENFVKPRVNKYSRSGATSDPNHRVGNKQQGHSAVQHVPLFLRNCLARVMAKGPVQHFYWPEKTIDRPEPA